MRRALILSIVLIPSLVNASAPIQRLRDTVLHTSRASASLVQGKSGKPYILTNWHVCLHLAEYNRLHASLPDGTSFVGEVKQASASKDLCALTIDSTKGVIPLILAPNFDKNEEIYTRGYPGGVIGEFNGKYTRDKKYTDRFGVSKDYPNCLRDSTPLVVDSEGLLGCYTVHDVYMVSFYVAGGSSGSPVVNSKGELVGVVVIRENASGDGGIVPYKQVKEFLNTL